jgi:hypothetical protein
MHVYSARWRFGENKLSIQKERTWLSIGESLQLWVYSAYLISIIGRFCFALDFHTGAVLGDFEPLEADCNILDTQRHIITQNHKLFSHDTSKSVATCGM